MAMTTEEEAAGRRRAMANFHLLQQILQPESVLVRRAEILGAAYDFFNGPGS